MDEAASPPVHAGVARGPAEVTEGGTYVGTGYRIYAKYIQNMTHHDTPVE